MKFEKSSRATAASVVAAIGVGEKSISPNALLTVPTVLEQAQNPPYEPKTFAELVSVLHYDAIKNKQPQQQFEFNTSHSTTRMFNLTHENINKTETQEIISLFENVARQRGHFSLQAHLVNGQEAELQFTIKPQPEHHRYILALPPKTPLYDLRPGAFTPDQGAGYTLAMPSADASVIIVRQPKPSYDKLKFQSVKDFLYTELCQSTYQIVPTAHTRQYFGEIVANLGQEVKCNSLDQAMVAAARNKPYEDYLKLTKGRSITVPGIGQANYLIADHPTYLHYQQILR